jgi:hypothetical protein
LLLDTLKQEHIEVILQEENKITDPEVKKYVAELLYKRTSGVPRFLAYACVKYLKGRIGPSTKAGDVPADLFGRKFIDFLHENKLAQRELNPSLGMREERKIFYGRLIALAALGVPLDLEATIQPTVWGLHADSSGAFKHIPLLDVMRLYNLYIEQGSDKQWRILFPEVVVDELALHEKSIEGLPFWVGFSRTRFYKAVEKGRLLEQIAANCMELSLLCSLGFEKGATWE